LKVAINKCYGGFGLSDDAVKRLAELKGTTLYEGETVCGNTMYYVDPELTDIFDCYHVDRNDPDLIRVIEELGDSANGSYADLKIVEIPDGIAWGIQAYDGIEWVVEDHRRWG